MITQPAVGRLVEHDCEPASADCSSMTAQPASAGWSSAITGDGHIGMAHLNRDELSISTSSATVAAAASHRSAAGATRLPANAARTLASLVVAGAVVARGRGYRRTDHDCGIAARGDHRRSGERRQSGAMDLYHGLRCQQNRPGRLPLCQPVLDLAHPCGGAFDLDRAPDPSEIPLIGCRRYPLGLADALRASHIAGLAGLPRTLRLRRRSTGITTGPLDASPGHGFCAHALPGGR